MTNACSDSMNPEQMGLGSSASMPTLEKEAVGQEVCCP